MPEKTVSKQTRAKWLLEICEEHVKKFVFNTDEILKWVTQTTELEGVDQECRWGCRAPDCNRTFAYHSGCTRKVLNVIVKQKFRNLSVKEN